VTHPSGNRGNRLETLWIVMKLLGDLASNPFHLAAFLLTAPARRRRLLAALQEAAP